jgi:hypothetical protein
MRNSLELHLIVLEIWGIRHGHVLGGDKDTAVTEEVSAHCPRQCPMAPTSEWLINLAEAK